MGFPAQFTHWIYLCISTPAFSVAVNGELAGYFTSSRGLRQGCSLSPSLYVIASNIFSLLLNKGAREGTFGYHPKRKTVAVTHLSFAEDILVFTDGRPHSISGILDIFAKFGHLSGLNINPSKSKVFAAGVRKGETISEASNRGIPVSALPIRYLGLPLTTKSMSRHDYAPLIDKIRRKMLTWSTKSLSYAGRLQLIKSVIQSLTHFWLSVFQLPKSCLTEIERLCGAFLWSGSPHIHSKAKVSWDDICYPKDEGGLGIRSLRDISKVYVLKLIWRLHGSNGSLWVSWSKVNLMKAKSLWACKESTNGSWIWRKILKIRHLANEFLKWELGKGEVIRYWWDRWLDCGRLIDLVDMAGHHRLGVGLHYTVSEAYNSRGWIFGHNRNPLFRQVIPYIQAHQIPSFSEGPDVLLWRHAPDNYRRTYSASHTWDQLRAKREKVSWYRGVWFPQSIPRYAFITWLATIDRLATGARTRQWGVIQACTLCGEREETRDHLFLACPYSFMLWYVLVEPILGRSISPDWSTTIATVSSNGIGTIDSTLLRLAFQACIYHLWKERNQRRHGAGQQMYTQIATQIRNVIKDRLDSLNYGSDSKFNGIKTRWISISEERR